MITLHRIDLKYTIDPCFAAINVRGTNGCRLLHKMSKSCNYKCPFYKPKDCKDWIRVEDRQGISVVPPEEYYRHRRNKNE